MNRKDIKLDLNKGVNLQPTARCGIPCAVVIYADERFDLTWER